MSECTSDEILALPEPDVTLTRDYLKALYGTAGAGFLSLWTAEDRTTAWLPVGDLNSTAAEVVRLAAERNVYHGLGLHPAPLGSSRRGSADGVCAIPGVWIDIDVRSPAHAETALPPAYADALDLLEEFPLPPSLVVDSGHGIYAFWLLKEVWGFDGAEERALAASLVRRMQAVIRKQARRRGWKLESTADLARMLRPVGAINRKPDVPPVLVRLLRNSNDRYVFEELDDVLPDDDLISLGLPTTEEGRDEGGRPDFGAILAGCAYLRHCRDDAAALPECEWHAMLTVVAQCRDGERLSHELSAPYPRYNPRETQRKFRAARQADKPLRCATIRDDRGGEAYCAGCPHWGRIASPIVLGYPRIVIEGQGNDGSASDAPSHPEAPDHAEASGPFALTDYGNAERLVARHGADLRFCYAFNRWLVWDGRRWQVDEGGVIRRLAKGTVRSIFAEVMDAGTKEERAALAKHALKSESAPKLEALLLMAQSEPGVEVASAELDRDPWLLNVANGTLDLRTGELRPHDRADLITKLVPVPYDPDAPCPTWSAFLDRVLGGKADLLAFVQRAAGYSLTGDTGERVLFILWGLGRNGKSTLLDTLLELLADYAARTTTDTLLTTRDGAIPNDVARLKGRRFVFAAEAEEGRRLAEAKVKDLTGGDTISARFMRGEWFDFRPEFKLWLGTNHKPNVRGSDEAIWDRIRLVPFNVRIPTDEQDKGLRAKLLAEAPGILAWAVQGCLAWGREGLGDPVAVREATSAYRQEMDLVGRYLEDCCVVRPSARATAKELYAAYQAWSAEVGEGDRPLSQKAFGQRLAERGFEAARVGKSRARYWVGVGLKDDEAEEADASDGADMSGLGFYDGAGTSDSRGGNSKDASECGRRRDATAGAGADQWTW